MLLEVDLPMREEANRFGDAVAGYLKRHKGELEGYAWPMSQAAKKTARELGFVLQDADGGTMATQKLRSDVSLRARQLHSLSGDERDGNMEVLCSFVIRVWGGLAGNGDDTIASFAKTYVNKSLPDLSTIRSLDDLREHARCKFPFKGISSWSKWLNFVWNDWALIYDARIAFALNAIHFLQDVDARAFPVPQGRDSLLSNIDTQSLAALRYLKRSGVQLPDMDAAHPQEPSAQLRDWLVKGSMPEDEAYAYYLRVMERVRDVMAEEGQCSLVETEMLLFYLSNRQVVYDLLRSLSNACDRVTLPF
jgi:hypothetical protein